MSTLQPLAQGEAGPASTEADEADPEAIQTELRTLTVGAAQHGLRLDKALSDLVPELSRSYLQQLQSLGCVRLDGQVVLRDDRRPAGDGPSACA